MYLRLVICLQLFAVSTISFAEQALDSNNKHSNQTENTDEACSIEQANRWSKGRNFINAYGPSEATVCATIYHKPEGTSASVLPIGPPIPNTLLYVLAGSAMTIITISFLLWLRF